MLQSKSRTLARPLNPETKPWALRPEACTDSYRSLHTLHHLYRHLPTSSHTALEHCALKRTLNLQLAPSPSILHKDLVLKA